MKKNLLWVAFVFLAHFYTKAQSLVVQEASFAFGKENYSAWVGAVEDGELAKDAYEKYASKKLNLDLKRGDDKHILVAKKINFSQVSSNKRGDLLFYFEEKDENKNGKFDVAMAFAFGYDIVVNGKDYPEEMKKLEAVMKGYLLFYYEESYNKQIKELEGKIKDLQRDIDKNKSKAKSLEKDNDKISKKVVKAKTAEEKMKLEQEKVNQQAEIQRLNDSNGLIEKQITQINSEIAAVRAKIAALK
jgi:prefoldin subunit 5